MAEMSEVHIVIETENVIDAVRDHRLLWDPAHLEYSAKDARRRAWGDICRTLMPDWDNFDDHDQNDIERKVQQRWRTARDCFVKARAARLTPASGGALRRDYSMRSYSHYDRLGFLEETLRSPGVPAAAAAVSLPRTPSERRGRPRARLGHGKRRRGAPLAVPSPPPGPPADTPDEEEAALSVFERRLLATLRARRSPPPPAPSALEPDDRDFFNSLAPMLTALGPAQKLQFRSQVLGQLQRQYARHLDTYNYVVVDGHHPADDMPDEDDMPDTKYRPPLSPEQ